MFIRIRCCCSALILAFSASLVAFNATASEPEIKVMSLSPAPLPVPALAHRLLPMESELLPGDAAPIYLRLAAGVTADTMASLELMPKPWLDVPIDQFPVNDARAFLGSWRPSCAVDITGRTEIHVLGSTRFLKSASISRTWCLPMLKACGPGQNCWQSRRDFRSPSTIWLVRQ